MNIDHLRYFCVTARHGNLAQASRLLHVTPSALSHAIDKLGGELGGELFERAGRGLSLTARGQALLPKAEALLEQADTLKRDLDGKQPRVTLRLGAPASLMGIALAPCLAAEAKRHPHVGFVLSQPSSVEALKLLREGKLDLALVFSEDKTVPEQARRVQRDELNLCARRDHPLARVPESRRAELLHHYPLASPQPLEALLSSADPALKRLFKRQGEVAFQYPSYEVAARLMQETDAWSFVPGWVLRFFARDLAPLQDTPICRGVDVVLHWHPKRCPEGLAVELATELEGFFARG